MFDFLKSSPLQKNQHFNISEQVSLHDKNWFQTGGPAKFYCRPADVDEFKSAFEFAQKKNFETFILGAGANILISDQGFNGLVIHPQNNLVEVVDQNKTHAFVKAGAGTVFDDLIHFCLEHHILGLEEFSGIPGTVGGSIYINLHYYEFLLEQFLLSATVMHKKTFEIMHVDNDWFNFGYDQSKLQDKEYIVLDAIFKLKKSNEIAIAHAKGRYKEIVRHRERRYPQHNTCGSFFRNFHPEEVEQTEKKLIFVAYYLDKLGIKGELSVGDAVVSHQHANMIVNRGNATSTNIITLAQTMQQMVYEKFQIKPQPECQLIGFDKNPLA